MASVIQLPGTPPSSGVSFDYDVAKEFLLDPVYSKPNISDNHTVYHNVKVKTQIAFMGLGGLSGQADASCGVIEEDVVLPFSEKFWDLVPVKAGFSQCWNDLKQSLLQFRSAGGNDRKDLTLNDLFVGYMAERTPDLLSENLLRRLWFSDTAIAAGDLSGGASAVPFFNLYDGFWKQIFDGVTATTIYRHTITENGLGTKALQDALATDTAYNACKKLYETADTRIFQDNPQFLITRTLMNNLIARDENQTTTNGRALTWNNGRYYFRGEIPFYVRDDWDRNIRTHLVSTTTWDLPHRLVLTTKSNLAIADDDTTGAEGYRMFFDQLTEKTYFQARLMEDAKILREPLIAVAY